MTPELADAKQDTKHEWLIAEVDNALALCGTESADPSIGYELVQLRLIRSALEACTLTAGDIVIGAFAAKNIADWNPNLAELLMRLDYKLRQELAQSTKRKNQAAQQARAVAA